MSNVLPSAKLFSGDMLGVGIGDGIVDRLGCAFVVVEEIRRLNGELFSVKSIITFFFCAFQRKVSGSRINLR